MCVTASSSRLYIIQGISRRHPNLAEACVVQSSIPESRCHAVRYYFIYAFSLLGFCSSSFCLGVSTFTASLAAVASSHFAGNGSLSSTDCEVVSDGASALLCVDP